MLDKIGEYLKKPLYEVESNPDLWNDDHISKGMLECHLNPSIEAASRLPSFIDASVKWINTMAPSEEYQCLLDLGCGPGMYAERLYKKGYTVTGIDFSSRSIEYARNQASVNKYNIQYLNQNYLEWDDDHKKYDVVIMIYCDYGVLSKKERALLLQKVLSVMKEGGKFIFDVFTPNQYIDKAEGTSWYLTEGPGFWKPDTYLCLEAHYIYEGNIRLDQHVIIDKEGNVNVFKVWDHYFTKEALEMELKSAGFKDVLFYSDVTGKEYEMNSKTLGVVAMK